MGNTAILFRESSGCEDDGRYRVKRHWIERTYRFIGLLRLCFQLELLFSLSTPMPHVPKIRTKLRRLAKTKQAHGEEKPTPQLQLEYAMTKVYRKLNTQKPLRSCTSATM